MNTSKPQSRSRGDNEHAFDMPENHLDVVVTPDSIDSKRKASRRTTILAVVTMPLFFLVAFSLSYVSATHSPTPHDLALTIAGPATVTEEMADQINDEAEGGFTVTQTTSATTARASVTDRDAVGAIIVDETGVTTIVASAAGRVTTPLIQNVGDRVAESLGTTATVEDVAPQPMDDPTGSVLFLFLVICTVGGFLSITVVSQSIPKAKVKPLVATAVGAAVLVPVIGFAMISLFVDFEVTFGTVAAVIGVGMLYTLTVALVASLLTLLLGQGAVLAVILFLVALSFPSSGGAVPESMLPPFWQALHNTWLGAGGYETMRSILFFDGAQAGRWLTQLFIWLGIAIVALAAAVLVMKRRSPADPAVLSTPSSSGEGTADATTETDEPGSAQPVRARHTAIEQRQSAPVDA